MNVLQEKLDILQRSIEDLEKFGAQDEFATQVYDAARYWHTLGTWVAQHDTKVDFPVLAQQEHDLWKKLVGALKKRPAEDRQRYTSLFKTAGEIIQVSALARPRPEGHLGILKIISEHFGFLLTDYGFRTVKTEPIGVRFSNEKVFVQLRWAKKHYLSCSFGLESKPTDSFALDDLLFMCGDQRYKSVPEELKLNTEIDVERWFKFVSAVFRECGRPLLQNEPGAFAKLIQAQSLRDEKYNKSMDDLYGKKGEKGSA